MILPYILVKAHFKIEDMANNELNNISQWMLSNELTLHPKKTAALNISPFSRNLTQT